MNPSLETSLGTMNLSGQQQPLSIPDASSSDDINDEIMAGFDMYSDNPFGNVLNPFDSDNSEEQLDINTLINDQSDPLTFLETQLSGTSIDNDDLNELFDLIAKQEPVENDSSQQHFSTEYHDSTNTSSLQQSTFIESYDQTNSFQSQSIYQSLLSEPVGNSPVEPKVIDISELIHEQDRLIRSAAKTKRSKTSQPRATTVGPVEYVMHSGGCQPCTTGQMQHDYAYQEQRREYNTADSKKIQIIGQPRPDYRPRTQNESKTSSHYIRCEDGVKPEYPTTSIPQTWFFQSDVNLIEVALVALDKQSHPYSIENKNSLDTYEDNALIFKQNDPSVLYFRITNEDYQNGYKTYMIELIKSKQNDVITKELIRSRQLEHSMLRFTRIFQIGKGNFQRDEGSVEYSSVMKEAYGDVDIEHMGPRYGPMSGQEMVYVVLKGRVLKNDLKIEITESLTGWSYSVENFTKNGNVVYFLMPAFPYPQFDTMKANIIIYYKGEELSQTTYLYKGSLDQELAELRLSDPSPADASSSMTKSFNAGNFFEATGAFPTSSSRKSSTAKRPKRLYKK